MTYYKSWQDAFRDFLDTFGDNYLDAYNLTCEFESKLGQNSKGSYFLRIDMKERRNGKST